ncbi:MAG: TraB/GumN family protein [Pseudoxanthomonas sp.]
MRLPFVALLVSTLVLAPLAHSTPAQPDEAVTPLVDSDGVRNLDAVVVTGVQPGPGMWKVSRDGHSLWVLGTLAPLPSGISWKADQVTAILEQADQVLGPPGLVVDADVGIFKALTLIPSALKASRNPDGKTLTEVLPADVYARWLALKPRYFGNDRGVEKKRPLLVANELYTKANRKAGLGQKPVITPVIEAVLKRRKMKLTPTTLKITIEDPKAAIKEFAREGVDDVECFRLALDRVENDIPVMVERANAWSVGDLDALRALPSEKQASACLSAMTGGEFARKRGLGDIEARIRNQWLKIAEQALQSNPVTFASMPISELQKENGYLSYLQARGYVVEAP